MKRCPAPIGAWIVVLAALLLPSRLEAQTGDAWVLRPGVLRLSIGGAVNSFEQRFGPGGERAAIAAPLQQPLDASAFAPLRTLSGQLGAFFEATAGGGAPLPVPIDSETLTLGTPDVGVVESLVRAPLRLSLGVAPRVEIGVGGSVERSERLLQRLTLSGGTVGRNPDPSANASRLAQLGEQWAELGGSALLPTAGSALGAEIQRRLAAAGAPALSLPQAAADSALLQSLLVNPFGLGPLDSRVGPWRAGDTEVFARVLVLSSFGTAPFPTDSSGIAYRIAVRGAARLPTGTHSASNQILQLEDDVGRSGVALGVDGDLFAGQRFWTTVGARYAVIRGGEVPLRPVPYSRPLESIAEVTPVTVDPGDELEVRVAPRLRLAEAVAVGLDYQMLWLGATTFAHPDADVASLQREGGAMHRLGVGIRYTTLPTWQRGTGGIGTEMGISYVRTLAGPEGVPAGGMVTISASVLGHLWGGSAP